MIVNKTSIDTGLWNIERYLMAKYGVDTAARDMAPLRWYVDTGRASTDTIRRVLMAKPFMVGRLLHKGGSYDDAIQRVISYVMENNSIQNVYDRTYRNCEFYLSEGKEIALANEIGVLRGICYCMEELGMDIPGNLMTMIEIQQRLKAKDA